MLDITSDARGLTVKVFVQPRSSKNAVIGLHGDALKLKLTAPPVEGAANKMCGQYLARCLGVPKSTVEVVAGLSNRTKRVRIQCPASETTARNRILKALRAMAGP